MNKELLKEKKQKKIIKRFLIWKNVKRVHLKPFVRLVKHRMKQKEWQYFDLNQRMPYDKNGIGQFKKFLKNGEPYAAVSKI